jgi:signal transduction histidine kinase
MVEDNDRMARYLGALARLNASQAHDARSQLGNLVLQVGLVEELLKRFEPEDPKYRDKLERIAGRAAAAAREVHSTTERLLALTRLGDAQAPYDLRDPLRDAEAQVAAYLRERGLQWTFVVPEAPVTVEGSRTAMFQSLVVALVESAEAMTKGSRGEARLDQDGMLSIAGPAIETWSPIVRATAVAHGGDVRMAGTPPYLTIHVPVQSRAKTV